MTFKTTYWSDFTIADKFGISAIKDTHRRAMLNHEKGAWYIGLTELVIVLNWKIWEWYEKNEEVARVYDELWRKTEDFARDNLKGEELSYFYETTD